MGTKDGKSPVYCIVGTSTDGLQPDNLIASGADVVYSQTLMAVIGALALEQGSAVANRIAKEKILLPLGLRRDMRELKDSTPS